MSSCLISTGATIAVALAFAFALRTGAFGMGSSTLGRATRLAFGGAFFLAGAPGAVVFVFGFTSGAGVSAGALAAIAAGGEVFFARVLGALLLVVVVVVLLDFPMFFGWRLNICPGEKHRLWRLSERGAVYFLRAFRKYQIERTHVCRPPAPTVPTEFDVRLESLAPPHHAHR